ncbi:hypothetical protein HJFPF1_04021 [Paramyrothecium foliicola]|nr:hypothetical protein HJFPF1_04021 [Paramyrothecium foliicola]
MAPLVEATRSLVNSAATGDFRAQWSRPGDVFTILLLLGGEVIARALAQLAGQRLTPVTFSFGWVAYSVSALVSAVGENKLMPPAPDCRCKVINGKNGSIIENSSWILGRIVRDFEDWTSPATKQKLDTVLEEKWKVLREHDAGAKRPKRAGLVITIYEPSTNVRAGVPKKDAIYWSGVFVMILQLALAAIPFGIHGNWGILMITAAGIGLALLTGTLPQWKKEKWACRSKSKVPYVLTRGNGSQHAIVILGNQKGLNLEDLATGQNNMNTTTNSLTRLSVLTLCISWVLLLITAAGLKENTWFLLAVGGIGMFHNIAVAGWSRRPESFGIPLEFVKVVGDHKAMPALFELEELYPGIGRSMRDEFFPGTLTPAEIQKWEKLAEKAA